MSQRKPYVYIEMDVDYEGTTKTLKLGPAVSGVPAGELIFPCLENVSLHSATVNIGGADDRMSAFGKRAKLEFTVRDFPYHGRWFASYESATASGLGTFFARLRAKWPAFSGRAVRYVEAYLDGGTITVTMTRNYILRKLTKSSRDTYTWTAYDPLDLAANDNALVPAPSTGVLAADITDTDTTATLSPTGVGDDEYPASGRCAIGSEYFEFTRSGDTLTFTSRAMKGTTAAAHSSGDSVQVAFYAERELADVFAARVLDEAGVSASYIPSATWASEVQRWAPTRKITTDIVKPTHADKIMGEISLIGFSFWWNDLDQEVGMKAIRPPDGETVHSVTDADVKSVDVDYRDEDRLTEILFSTVLKSPFHDASKSESYSRQYFVADTDAIALHGDANRRAKEVNCRLLNDGRDTVVRQIAKRLLKRRTQAPGRYEILLDAKDRAIGLTDIVELTSRSVQDADGNEVPITLQVVEIKQVRRGHEFTVIAQEYEYGGRLAYVADPATPVYGSATDQQKIDNAFIADISTGLMPGGDAPYEII